MKVTAFSDESKFFDLLNGQTCGKLSEESGNIRKVFVVQPVEMGFPFFT